MLESIDHIGFAVRDIDESIAFYSAMFGEIGAEPELCQHQQRVALVCITSPTVWTTLRPRWHS